LRTTLVLLILCCLLFQACGAAAAPSVPNGSQSTTSRWADWSRDADNDRLDDELEFWLDNLEGDRFDVIICYDRSPSRIDTGELEAVGGRVDHISKYLPMLTASLPRSAIDTVLAMPGVARIEAGARLEFALDTSVPSVGIDTVWKTMGLRGSGVTTAVIDSGIDGNHTDLNDMDDINNTIDPKIIAFYDAASSPDITDGSQWPFDQDGHGSHIAGVASGTGDGNPFGKYVGVAPGSNLVGVKILANGSTDMASGDAIRGIEWAMSNAGKFGIGILSMSFGSKFLAPGITNDGNSAMSQLCNQAVAEGLVVVAAAGNNGPARRSISPPGDARDVITVGNVNDDHSLNPTSSRGPVGRYTSSYTKPDVCAPGTDIYSADANTGDKFKSQTGTSDACPHVSGLVAIMLQANPKLRPADVMSLLHSSAGKDSNYPWQGSPNNDFGWGVVDAVRAVENCTNGTMPPVVLIHPMEKANGTVQITGTASSARSSVQSVEVRIDGGSYRLATGTSVWKYSWDTTGYPNGAHTITARAFDGKLYSYEYRIATRVDNLVINITPIQRPDPLIGEWTFSGHAGGSGIREVQVRIDTGYWIKAALTPDAGNATSKWEYSMNTTKLTNGKHRLEARAFDGARYSGEAALDFNVENPVKKTPRKTGGLSLPGFEALPLLAVAALLLLGRRRRP